MQKWFRVALSAMIGIVFLLPMGCGEKVAESKPNKDLTIPDIPAAKPREGPGTQKK